MPPFNCDRTSAMTVSSPSISELTFLQVPAKNRKHVWTMTCPTRVVHTPVSRSLQTTDFKCVYMVARDGIEPPTPAFSGPRSTTELPGPSEDFQLRTLRGSGGGRKNSVL